MVVLDIKKGNNTQQMNEQDKGGNEMKRYVILLISIAVFLSACSGINATGKVKPEELLTEAHETLKKQKSYKGMITEELIAPANIGEKIVSTTKKEFSIIRENLLAKEELSSKTIGNDAENFLPEDTRTMYTEINPENNKELISYTHYLDQWSKDTRIIDVDSLERFAKDPIFDQDYKWKEVLGYKDYFKSLEEGEKQGKKVFILKATVPKEEQLKELRASKDLDKELLKSMEKLTTDVQYEIQIDPETKLPLSILKQFNLPMTEKTASENKEIFEYTEFNTVDKIEIPKEAKDL